jgi:hypothetical protein
LTLHGSLGPAGSIFSKSTKSLSTTWSTILAFDVQSFILAFRSRSSMAAMFFTISIHYMKY